MLRKIAFRNGIVIISFFLFYSENYSYLSAERAFILDPVVNFYYSDSFESGGPLSYSGGLVASKRPKPSCPSHQGLYNESVTVIRKKGNRICVAWEDLIYGFDPNGNPENALWTEEEHLLYEEALPLFAKQTFPAKGKECLTLLLPYNGYSAGTRFVRDPDRDSGENYGIIRFCPIEQGVVFATVPKNRARPDSDPLAEKKCLPEIILAMIADAESFQGRVIPYVLGGSSYTVGYEDAFFQGDAGFERIGPNLPYSGYDCSELIFRAAKMIGLDFPWKTTKVMRQKLRPLVKEERIEDGDLLWFPGHIIMVGNRENNEVIESRGYESGFGKVHVLSLSRYFLGVSDYEDLREKKRKNLSLFLLNAEGRPYMEIFDWEFLRPE